MKNKNTKKKMSRKKNNYKKGDIISVYLPSDLSDGVLKWINTREFYGPAIIRVLEQVVSGELVPINYVKSIIDINVKGHSGEPLLDSVEDKKLRFDSTDKKTIVRHTEVKKELDNEKNINKRKDRSIPQFSFTPDIANTAKSIIDDD